ncbi:glycosyltransferase family 4 protein [Clostridium homopropionicum]|nr:glycosyltransferase family 4 protein [Clostridium homopropionicum]
MKKVLFITTRLIYPTNSGRKVVLYNYCKGLKELYDYDVYLYSFLEDGETKELKQPKFISDIYYAEQPGKLEKFKNILINSLIKKKWPLQVSLYYSKKTHDRLIKIINKISPEILICDMARTAEYLRNINIPNIKKVLDMDDLISKRYIRQANNDNLNISTFGIYTQKMPLSLKKILNYHLLIKKILKLEGKLLAKYEIGVCNDFEKIIFVSSIEADEYNRKTNSNKAIDVTIGVDYDYFSEKVAKIKQQNLIGFLGNMYVSHNRDAVSYFLKEIFPEIKKNIPNVKFRIIGRCSNEYKIQFKELDYLEVTGEVEDIREYVQECSVMVAPLTYGSGIKTKILETMAMGTPVVTNNIGVEGIMVENNKHIFVCENKKDFASKVIMLLKDANLNMRISDASKRNIYKRYTWNNTLKNIKYII